MVSPEDVQRLFLQAVLSRRVMSASLARVLWKKCIAAVKAADDQLDIPHSNSRDGFNAFVADINKSLNNLDLTFASRNDEVTGKETYALVNSKADDVAQLATEYSPIEITFFKAIVEQIMFAPRESFSVSSLLALREVSHLKSNMTKSQAENVLGSFVAKGWLLKSKRGRYSLSTRSLMELEPYLKDTYPDQMNECSNCGKLVTRGVACHHGNCKAHMHYWCFSRWRNLNEGCPACKKAWPEDAKDGTLRLIGEEAAKGDRDDHRMTRRQTTEDKSDAEEDEAPARTQRVTKVKKESRKKKGKRRASRADDMDVDSEGEAEESPEED